jgi:hypothetical protein
MTFRAKALRKLYVFARSGQEENLLAVHPPPEASRNFFFTKKILWANCVRVFF